MGGLAVRKVPKIMYVCMYGERLYAWKTGQGYDVEFHSTVWLYKALLKRLLNSDSSSMMFHLSLCCGPFWRGQEKMSISYCNF